MKREEVLARLKETTLAGDADSPPQPVMPLVQLRGGNALTVNALNDGDLLIRYFPYRIGRKSRRKATGLPEIHLSLEEHAPYHLSRFQVALVRRGREILLVDPDSRQGSVLDGEPLGRGRGGPAERVLPPGTHELRLGNANAPFVFILQVGVDPRSYTLHELVSLGADTVPVSYLYEDFYHRTRQSHALFFRDGAGSLEMARALVALLLAYPPCLDPLYYYSAIPIRQREVIASHSLNVLLYALKLGKTLPLPGEGLVTFALAAFFHDIGMYELPEALVNKREVLTNEEYGLMRRHPQVGHDQLISLARRDPLLPAVALAHHERIDGQGYPRGDRNLSKSIELIAMADFFEALTHHRPQRGPLSPHQGMCLLIQQKKGIFSPRLVKHFVKVFSLFPIFSVVRLNTGEIGQVVATHPDDPLRPLCRGIFDRHGQALNREERLDLRARPSLYITEDLSDRVFVDHYFRL